MELSLVAQNIHSRNVILGVYEPYPVKSSWADFFLDFDAAWCGVYTNGSADGSQHARSGNENRAPNIVPPGFTWKKWTISHTLTRSAVTCGIKGDDTAECWPYTNYTILDPFTWKQLRAQLFYSWYQYGKRHVLLVE
eukprot:GILK01008593.1.p1 GENE.GILK01008593.1~~GILK01008593.1.p1  ORF type:complete len:137 (+),score=4.43 GILK01008593.1:787-1197(+)